MPFAGNGRSYVATFENVTFSTTRNLITFSAGIDEWSFGVTALILSQSNIVSESNEEILRCNIRRGAAAGADGTLLPIVPMAEPTISDPAFATARFDRPYHTANAIVAPFNFNTRVGTKLIWSPEEGFLFHATLGNAASFDVTLDTAPLVPVSLSCTVHIVAWSNV